MEFRPDELNFALLSANKKKALTRPLQPAYEMQPAERWWSKWSNGRLCCPLSRAAGRRRGLRAGRKKLELKE